MVTDKITRDQKRKLMLEDKAKRKEIKTERLIAPYNKPKKVTIRNYDDLPDGQDY